MGVTVEKYVVVELQTMEDGKVANLVTQHDTREEAESKFHSVLATAAISGLPVHGAVLMNNHCFVLDTRCYGQEA